MPADNKFEFVTDRCSTCAAPVRLSIVQLGITPATPAVLTASCPYCSGAHRRELSDTVTELLLDSGAKLD